MKKTTLTILVVDDDPDDLVLIQAAFKAAGVVSKIQITEGGHEAVAYFKGEGKFANRAEYGYPDAVLTDLKMPGFDGFAVLEFVKQNPESAIVPTVVLSGSQDNDDIKKAYLLGASSYHVKPSAPGELRTLVKVLHDYWMLCETPAVGVDGKQLSTDSTHKLGERFSLKTRA